MTSFTDNDASISPDAFNIATAQTTQASAGYENLLTTTQQWLEDSLHAENCSQLNDILWEFRRDATTLPFVIAIFAILYSIIIIFGVVGNMCVILAIARTKSLQTVPNMFIFSLSCSDVVVCCTSATITPITAFKKEWLFGGFLCSVAPFIALICVLAMGMSMPIVFMQKLRPLEKYCGKYCFEDWGHHTNKRRAYGTLMLMLQFVIPLSVIIFCYTAISLRLQQSVILKNKKTTNEYDWQLTMSDQQKAAMKRRQRTNRMFIAMVWNPILYALLNLQLRAAFIQLMPTFIKKMFNYFCCCHRHNNKIDDHFNGEIKTRLLTENKENNNKLANGHNDYLSGRRNSPQTAITQLQQPSVYGDKNSPPDFIKTQNGICCQENSTSKPSTHVNDITLNNLNQHSGSTKKYGSFDIVLANVGANNYGEALSTVREDQCHSFMELSEPSPKETSNFNGERTTLRNEAESLFRNWRNAYDSRELEFRQRQKSNGGINNTRLSETTRRKSPNNRLSTFKQLRHAESPDSAPERYSEEYDEILCQEQIEIWRRFEKYEKPETSKSRLRSSSLIPNKKKQKLYRQKTLPSKS